MITKFKQMPTDVKLSLIVLVSVVLTFLAYAPWQFTVFTIFAAALVRLLKYWINE